MVSLCRGKGIVKSLAAADDRVVVATDRAVLLCHNFAEDAAPSKFEVGGMVMLGNRLLLIRNATPSGWIGLVVW